MKLMPHCLVAGVKESSVILADRNRTGMVLGHDGFTDYDVEDAGFALTGMVAT